MNKKKILTTILAMTMGLLVAVGLSYATGIWSDPDPTKSVPSGNRLLPVTVLPQNQVKAGDLTVGSFLASADAQFDQQVWLDPNNKVGKFFGGTNQASGIFHIGGTVEDANLDDPDSYTVATTANGYVQATKELGATELASDKKYRLCADEHGHIVFCAHNGEYLPSQQVETGSTNEYVWSGMGMDGAQYQLFCAATISQPAPAEGVTIDIKYVWSLGTSSFDNNCSVIIPGGATTGSTDPFTSDNHEGGYIVYGDGWNLTNSCVTGAQSNGISIGVNQSIQCH